MSTVDHYREVLSGFRGFLANSADWEMSLSGTGAIHLLEEKFATLVGQPYALAVSNATLGLWAIFAALEPSGGEVLTTPYTWGGTLAGALHTRRVPRFADIDPASLTLNPESVRNMITPRTRAILAVDIYGHPCDGVTLGTLAHEHGCFLIQDCAQSFGAYRNGHHTGFAADATVFSFGWRKAVFAGEGGVIVTRDKNLYERLVWLTQHPLRQRRDVPNLPSNEMAMNLRINPLAAVWASATFDRALDHVACHREEFLKLRQLLEDEALATGLPDCAGVRASFATFTCVPSVPGSVIADKCRANGVGVTCAPAPIRIPIYRHEAYRLHSRQRGWKTPTPCPVAEEQCASRIRLVRDDEVVCQVSLQKGAIDERRLRETGGGGS